MTAIQALASPTIVQLKAGIPDPAAFYTDALLSFNSATGKCLDSTFTVQKVVANQFYGFRPSMIFGRTAVFPTTS